MSHRPFCLAEQALVADEGDGVGGVQFGVGAVGQVNQGDAVAVVGGLAAQVLPDHDDAGVYAGALEQAGQEDALQQALALTLGDGVGELEAFIQAEVRHDRLDHAVQLGAVGALLGGLSDGVRQAGQLLLLGIGHGQEAVGRLGEWGLVQPVVEVRRRPVSGHAVGVEDEAGEGGATVGVGRHTGGHREGGRQGESSNNQRAKGLAVHRRVFPTGREATSRRGAAARSASIWSTVTNLYPRLFKV